MIVDETWTAGLAESYMGIQPRDWEAQAACRPSVRPAGITLETFYSERSFHLSAVKRLCADCPVRVACVMEAIAAGETSGVRGAFNFGYRKEREAAGQWLKDVGFRVPQRTYASVDEILKTITRRRDEAVTDPWAMYRPLPGESTHTCVKCGETLSLRAWGNKPPPKRTDHCYCCRNQRRRERQAS